jgi:K+-transporting ATPase KdpF subunit
LVANASEETSMLVDYILGGVVTAALLVYLTWALLRPERF